MRSKRGLFLFLTLTWALAAADASATIYLNEDFDAGTLPAGWVVQKRGSGSSSYGFMPRSGGYYYYASVTVYSEQ